MDVGLSHAAPLSVALETTTRLSAAAPAPNVIRLAGLKGAAPAFFLARHLHHTPQPTLCVLPSDKQAETFAADLRFFIGQDLAPRVRYYPAWDVSVADGLSPNSEVVAAQIEGLYDLLSVATPILVTSAQALLQRLLPQEEFITATFRLRPGDELPLSAFVDYCLQWGYRRVPLVEEKGEISVRGGIVDLFPTARPVPAPGRVSWRQYRDHALVRSGLAAFARCLRGNHGFAHALLFGRASPGRLAHD